MTSLLLAALLALAPDLPAEADWAWAPDPFVQEASPSPLLAGPAAETSTSTPVPTSTSTPVPTSTPTPVSTPASVPASAPASAQAAPEPPSQQTWYDEGHAIVTEGLLWSVERLDQFFSDERTVDLPRNTSFVRWRNDLKITDGGKLAFTTGARAELRIPSLDRRLEKLRLTISAGTTDALDRLIPTDTPSPDASSQPSAGLRLFILETLLTQADVQAGLLFTLPVGWYTRLVFRHVHPVEHLLVARMALSNFWQTNTGFGTRQDLDLERQLAPWLLLRHANTGIVTERSRGWEWSSELALLAAVGDRTALFLGGGASGATHVGPVVEIWQVHARARRDVLRRWLFLEVEPGVQWRRPPGGGPRERERSIILRLEVQFGGPSHLPVPAPAPAQAPPPTPPPEPAPPPATPPAAPPPAPAAAPPPGS